MNSVEAGLVLARRIVAELLCGHAVTLDVSGVERLTPSFANAVVMTVAQATGLEVVRTRLSLSGATPLVAESWARAVDRYQRGIRLSNQRPEVA